VVERVERLEERMMRFEQDLRGLHGPSAQTLDTEGTATPATGEDTIQEEHNNAPEGT
jgi:hypothetical protein